LRGGWWNEGARQQFGNGRNLFERADGAEDFEKDFPDVLRLVEKIGREVKVKPYDGLVVFNPGAAPRFSVEGAREGRDLDEEKLCADILRALKSGGHRNVAAKISKKPPRDPREIIGKLGLRGGYTTYFEENLSRQNNIELALAKFNGLTVHNGQTISFNQVVGPRTAARGFEEAKIILDGEFVPGIGGGVCQSSTTVFNAALLAGLDIDKSHSHSLAVGYVPVGRDAMVSSSADLRFTNRTGGTIYIETGVTPAVPGGRAGAAWVKVYGNKTNIKYRPRTTVTEKDLGEDEIDPARQSSTYIEAWSGDRLVNSKLVRKSRYNARLRD
jgi:hypothetical protein